MKRWPLAVVILLAVGLRIAAIVHLQAWKAPAEENRIIARNLASGQGYTFADFAYLGPTTLRPPLYPFILAGLDRALGTETSGVLAAALALNVLAGGIATGLIFLVVRQTAGRRAALIAALLLAIWPTQIYAAAQFQGLSLAVMLMLATLWLCQKQWPLLAGIGIGLAALCESILLLPLLAVGVWCYRKKADGLILLVTAVVAITLPWAYRNTIVRQRPTLLTGHLGSDLFYGNGPGATGSQHLASVGPNGKPLTELDQVTPKQFDALRHQPEAAREALFFDWAKDWIAGHPAAYLKLCGNRVLKTVWLDWSHPLAKRPLNLIARTLACVAAFVAIGWHWRTNLPMALMLAGLTIATMFTIAEARNSVLIDIPQLIAVATLFKPKTE